LFSQIGLAIVLVISQEELALQTHFNVHVILAIMELFVNSAAIVAMALVMMGHSVMEPALAIPDLEEPIAMWFAQDIRMCVAEKEFVMTQDLVIVLEVMVELLVKDVLMDSQELVA